MTDYEAARVHMVDSQLRTTDVTSHTVLSAFLTVPREAFLPDALKPFAYVDEDMPITQAVPGTEPRYIMEPSPLAKLIQLADIRKTDVVLEVGSAEGYVAAVLSLLAGSVVALESDEVLAASSAQTLSALGYDNVAVVTGVLPQGYPSEAPYDLIFLNGAAEEVPEALLSQLRDGGRLVAVTGNGHAARATVISREGTHYSTVRYFNAAIKVLPGFRKAAEFVF
ncbi:protein-L-isoaspartate O-methyltransferase [Rhizobiaceae bacterium BDR2-2]|uniref:Protein-L-isoaspartate O-methyltransferase n=1 Tax=Ectorhizobium quercum TaxID=2965071 RepID=A0AAE3SVD6_9HYPH|nr:protein-L-isoaspartate O-methyltransferase [Ectorhizobium quercum]MCX8997553.1 protein-L-isoaspartate O-methyltransferase [Ectorhizobium quercum]